MENERGVKRVKKRTIIIATALMTLAMLATPLVGTVFALGKPNNAETFYTYSQTSSPTLIGNEIVPPEIKWVGPVIDTYPNPDGSFRSASGAVRMPPYQGALGSGVLRMTTVHSLTKYITTTDFSGGGTYNITLEIAGNYGTGKLEGMAQANWDYVSTRTPKYEEWWTMSLHGKGDLNGLNVFVEGYAAFKVIGGALKYVQWWNTTIS